MLKILRNKYRLHQDHVQNGAAKDRQQVVMLPDVEDHHHSYRQQGGQPLAEHRRVQQRGEVGFHARMLLFRQ